MEPTPSAAALAAAASAALGLQEQPKHLTGRKGANTWRAGTWTIKTATPGARGHLAHEHAAYKLLHSQGRHPGPRGAAGAEGRWMAVPWIDGRPLWDVFAPARQGTDTAEQRTQMRNAARAALTALKQFHAAGWTHGDMQTENTILLQDGTVEFIDYDNAHHPELPLPFPYRGGMVHVLAPETAAHLLATGEEQHVPLSPEAELFALGAALYWAWTGIRPTDYRGDPAGAHTQLYADIANGRRRDLTRDRPWADPELEALIRGATEHVPASRQYDGAERPQP